MMIPGFVKIRSFYFYPILNVVLKYKYDLKKVTNSVFFLSDFDCFIVVCKYEHTAIKHSKIQEK